MNFNFLEKLSGDASLRQFYRDKKNKTIIIYCKKDKYKNLLVYDAINKLLRKNKINSPSMLKQSYTNNYIEIEDLGKNHNIKNFKKFDLKKYEDIFKILDKFKKIKNRKINTFLNTKYTIPIYSEDLLYSECKLFTKWYMPTIVKKNKNSIAKNLNKILKSLIKKLKLKKKIFVHRDFHLSNIILFKNKIFLIDTQDAVFGNQAYDLASIIDDVRNKVSLNNREKLYNKFIKGKKNLNKAMFRNDFEILSALRNLKIIGIFTRLSIRDKKHSYKKMIPYAWQMIFERCQSNKELKELINFIKLHFTKYI